MNFINIGGLPTVNLTKDSFAELMLEDCCRKKNNPNISPKLVFSSNGQGLSLANSDKSFKEAMLSADYIHADGQSLVLYTRLFRKEKLVDRIATTDFFHNAAKVASENDIKFYFLGAKKRQLIKAVKAIKLMYPNLEVVGYSDGYFNSRKEAEIISEINLLKPDVLWVGLGKPRQEYWSFENKTKLDVAWIKTCGGLYSFLANESPRAPLWMQKSSLEWLFRLLNDPKRLGLRYLKTNPHAIYCMLFKSK